MEWCYWLELAAEVRRPYEFIGIFDFVVFALHHKVEVLMLFGSYVVDLLQTFTSSLRPLSADWPKARKRGWLPS